MIFKYPYTNLYNLNLDWIIQAIKEVQTIVEPLDRVVNSVNGMTGDVEITKALLTQILGGLVETFNGRSGAVELTAEDVNATLIDIVWTSDPGETIRDLTQTQIDEMYASGMRILIFVNNLGVADQVYFLQWYDNHAMPQEYTPTSALAGVASFNGMTGNVVATGDDIATSATDTDTIAESLAEKVPVTRAVNGQPLSSNVNLDADDIPSAAISGATTVEMALGNLNASKVPNARTVNGKQLLNDIVLNDEDIPSSVDGKTDVEEVLEYHSEEIAALDAEMTDKADIIISEASGAVASFEDGADGLPVESLTVEIEPVQAGTGVPSPTNVRPITGWTGANVVVSPTTDAEDGTTYTITFPTEAGTVYGGTLTVNEDGTGTLRVDVFKYRVPRDPNITVSTNSYIKSDACDAFLYVSPTMYPELTPSQVTSYNICNILKRSNIGIWSQVGYPNTFTLNSNQFHLNIANDVLGITDYTQETLQTVRTKIINYLNSLYDAGTYVEVTYKIKPIEYTLTPTEITTLLGVNNVWANTGDVSVSYRADTKAYVNQRVEDVEREIDEVKAATAYVEEGNTATQKSYAAGEFILWKGALYTVNSGGIPVNTAITGHVTAVTGGGLNALNTAVGMRPRMKTFVITQAQGITTETTEIAFTPPTGVTNDVVTLLLLYSEYDNVFFQWRPQTSDHRMNLATTWAFNVINRRGSTVGISTFYATVLY